MDITLLNKVRYGHLDSKWVHFRCEDGRVFKFPAKLIAFDRAYRYAEIKDAHGIQVSLDDDTIELFVDDWYIIDWMRNNMEYDDYKEFLVQVKHGDSEMFVKEGWINGAHEVI